MRWFPWEERDKQQAYGRPIALGDEVDAVFKEEREYLLWTVQVITGNDLVASESIVDASRLASKRTSIFRDWLTRWAHSATARTAIAAIHEALVTSSTQYPESPCSHLTHEVLTKEQTATLRLVDPTLIAAELDPLARAVLVLRGMQHDSIFDCALLVNVPRRIVAGAYCRALQWTHKRLRTYAVTAEDLAPVSSSCAHVGA